jgi:hypothetical protein
MAKKETPKDPHKEKQEKIYNEIMKREILQKIKSRIDQNDDEVLKTLKIYLDEKDKKSGE